MPIATSDLRELVENVFKVHRPGGADEKSYAPFGAQPLPLYQTTGSFQSPVAIRLHP